MLGAARVYLELDRQGDQATTHPSQAHTFVNLLPLQQVFTVLTRRRVPTRALSLLKAPSPFQFKNLLRHYATRAFKNGKCM